MAGESVKSGEASTPPRVSVIIPAYNRRDLLPETLDSVLAQTYGDWEAIVIDDASTDDTCDVARGYARRDPERVRVLALERNQGIAGARMAGIRSAGQGDLLCLLDSDDYWAPAYLERSVATYDSARAEGRRVGVVACNALMLTGEGITGETWSDRNGWIDEIDLDATIKHNYLLARAIISRDAWVDAGGEFAPECRGSDDYDLWLRILELGYEALAIREPLVVYRDHAGADSHDHLARSEGVLAAYRRALARDALSSPQRRTVRAQMRHYRALRDRELAYRALAARRPLQFGALAARALPTGAIAFAQDRSRWREWLGDLRRPGGNLSRVRAVVERER